MQVQVPRPQFFFFRRDKHKEQKLLKTFIKYERNREEEGEEREKGSLLVLVETERDRSIKKRVRERYYREGDNDSLRTTVL